MLPCISTTVFVIATFLLLPSPAYAVVGGYVDVNGYRYKLANTAVDVDVFDYAGDDCAALPCASFPIPATCNATFTTPDITTVVTSKNWGAPFVASSSGIYSAVSWLSNPSTASILDLSVPGYVALSDYGYQARILLRCSIPCPAGAILVGNACANCSIGTFPSAGRCVSCTNALANAVYTSFGTANNCPWNCSSNRYLRDTYAPTLLVADIGSPSAVRMVSSTGYVSTIYMPTNPSDPTYNFRFMAISTDKLSLYLGTSSISRVNIATGSFTPLVGSSALGSTDGTGAGSTFYSISAVAPWRNDASLVVSDQLNCNLRLVTMSSLSVSTLAGLAGNCGYRDAVGTFALFRAISDVAVDSVNDIAYVADTTNYRIRAVYLNNQTVTTIAGNGVASNVDGVGALATINPNFLALSGTDSLYVKTAYSIRRIDLVSFVVTTVVPSTDNGPLQLAMSSINSQFIYFSVYYKIRSLFVPTALTVDITSGLYGFTDGLGANGRFRYPLFMAVFNETVVPNSICMTCTSCSVGSYGQCTANASNCITCPPDQFSFAGASTCSYCPAGKYASSGVCLGCTAGTFSSAGSTGCASCGIGNFSVALASVCAPCPAGKYAVAGTCFACGNGTFSNAGSTVCGNCSAGQYLPIPTGVCVSCASGTYSLDGSTACLRCTNLPSNATYSGSGGTNSTNCDYICNSGFSYVSGMCSICAPGNWTVAGISQCAPCYNLPSNATYSGVGSNATNCPIACDPGFYVAPRNSSLCLPCAAGTRMVNGVCVPCPSGGYSAAGAATCLPCMNGNYALGNATACTSCPNQSPFTAFMGRGTNAACSFICTAGSYIFNRTTCTACDSGTYTGAAGMTACSACTGSSWSGVGASVCTACSYLNITATYNGTICADYPTVCRAGFSVATIQCVP